MCSVNMKLKKPKQKNNNKSAVVFKNFENALMFASAQSTAGLCLEVLLTNDKKLRRSQGDSTDKPNTTS